MVVGGEPEADTNRVVVFSAPDIGAAATWAGGAGGRRDRDRKWRLYQALLARRVRAGGGVAGRSGLRRDGPSIRMVMQ